jgi:hypothetical protein
MRQLPRVAQQNHWKTLDLPEQHVAISVDRVFSDREMQLIKLGLIPQEMEEKWFAYFSEDRLYLHRSWTGFCIYVVRFEKRDEQYIARELLLNRDRSQYRQTDDFDDAEDVFGLIDHLLLHPRNLRPEFELRVGGRRIE